MVEPNPASPEEPESPSVSRGLTPEPTGTNAPQDGITAGAEHTAPARHDPVRTTDEIFSEIVADLRVQGWDEDPGRGVGAESGTTAPATSRPVAPPETARSSGGTPDSVAGGWDFPVAPWLSPGGPRDVVPTPELDELQESENHFVPPDPGNVLGPDRLVNLAWVVVVFAPIALIAGLALWSPAPRFALEALGAAFIAALVILMWRIPSTSKNEDSGPGAVV